MPNFGQFLTILPEVPRTPDVEKKGRLNSLPIHEHFDPVATTLHYSSVQ
jgi:hypothetical protein